MNSRSRASSAPIGVFPDTPWWLQTLLWAANTRKNRYPLVEISQRRGAEARTSLPDFSDRDVSRLFSGWR
jgi:hypothetical protein